MTGENLAKSNAAKIAQYPVWVLYLVFPFRYGKWLSSILILIAVWVLLTAVGGRGEFYLKLFFSMTCAYIIPVCAHIIERSVSVFDQISPMLGASSSECAQWRKSLSHSTLQRSIVIVTVSLILWSSHMVWIESSIGHDIFENEHDARTFGFTGSLLVWLSMTTVFTTLISNALLFARLSRRLQVDLLRGSTFLPLAQVAVGSTLAIAGSQILFVLLYIGTDYNWIATATVALSSVPLLAIFLIPVWPMHKRLQTAKRKQLEEIDVRLVNLRPDSQAPLSSGDQLAQLNELLLFRREIRSVSEWPFNVPVLIRLGLYMLLPPLTWVGAALIENLVNVVLI